MKSSPSSGPAPVSARTELDRVLGGGGHVLDGEVGSCPLKLAEAAARSRGQGGAPGWRNDLDRGEDRGDGGRRWARVTAKRRARAQGLQVLPRC